MLNPIGGSTRLHTCSQEQSTSKLLITLEIAAAGRDGQELKASSDWLGE